MKKLNLAAAVLIAVLAFTACKKEKTDPRSDVKTAREFTQKNGSQKETFTFNTADLPKTIKLSKGTKITIRPNSFLVNDKPASGTVVIETYEMLKRSDIIFSGGNTNHISGRPLISQGFIYVNAKINGQQVDSYLQVPLNIQMPAQGKPYTELWEGIEDVDGNDNFAWQAPGAAAGQGPRGVKANNADMFDFDFGKLGWINCDVFYNDAAPKTTVRVKILNNPGDMASFMGYSGHTFVLYCATGDNVVAQLYTADGPNQVKSYDDSMPMGSQGKLISYSIKDGKFYFAKKDITITTNMNETLTLVETTEAAIQAEINALN